jgi:hypothetical protein
MKEETALLQREIEAEKASLADNLSALEAKARGLTDWRAQVRKHPLASIGVALAAGAAISVLAQRRTIVVVHRPHPDGDATPQPASPPSHLEHLMANPVVERVVGALVAVAAAKAVDVLSDMMPEFGRHIAKDDAPPPRSNGSTPPADVSDRRGNPVAQGA